MRDVLQKNDKQKPNNARRLANNDKQKPKNENSCKNGKQKPKSMRDVLQKKTKKMTKQRPPRPLHTEIQTEILEDFSRAKCWSHPRKMPIFYFLRFTEAKQPKKGLQDLCGISVFGQKYAFFPQKSREIPGDPCFAP